MLDLFATPIIACALGAAMSFSRTAARRDDAGRRVRPWRWIADHPWRTAHAALGSLLGLALLDAAGLLATQPAAGLLAAGVGLAGVEIADAVQRIAPRAARAALKRLGGGGQGGYVSPAPLLTLTLFSGAALVVAISPAAAWWLGAALGAAGPVALVVLVVRHDGWRELWPSDRLAQTAALAVYGVIAAWWAGLALWAWAGWGLG
jgi:hypothetical protein